ncbi:MAG: bifunctional methylenetetrahydrofolate dehydrogenase/methenyltetrahydrofolate cyclohydrolase FolD [Deltaproteobacteria bacterium]|nr:bifunctional methylenetetrahydrofolate dehydrogenase/methenyltetrahydrofolate cyclohydrolase FolD [Deltaproteobacteria bacterium]
MAKLIDGKETAKNIREELKKEVEELGLQPGLAVVLVGEDPASQVYVRNKEKACATTGIASFKHTLSAETTEEELLGVIKDLNSDDKVHGILVQLPLPKQINEHAIIEAIDPAKDVDGFHPFNVGRLTIGRPTYSSCTPFGIMELLKRYDIDIEGKDAVIVGRSNIVGKPMALMLLAKNATISICHSRTKNLDDKVRAADIVVAAVGRAEFVKGDWIKDGAIVIDVGINRTDNGLVGDVEFTEAEKRASYITPVPGGVGPMTIAMLLKNTVEAAKQSGK